MRKVRGSRPAGVKGKKEEKMRKEPGKYEEEKDRRMELGEEVSRQKTARKEILFYSYSK